MTNLKSTDLNVYDLIDSSYTALFGLQYMLEHTFEQTTGFPAIVGAGISELFQREVSNLAVVKSQVAALVDRLKSADLAESLEVPDWHDIATISARARVHKSEVARVMFVLTGADHEGAEYRAWDGNLSEGLHSHLLANLCYEALARGDMWGQISTATELPLEKVKQVLQAMLTYTPTREAIELGTIAKDSPQEQQNVQRVVERLQADPRPTIAPDQMARAVNN